MKKIIVDTDPGVDDAVAILFALAHPGLDVAALTTVAGNVDIDNTTNNALGLLKLAGGYRIPVHRGAASPISDKPARASAAHGKTGLGGVELDSQGMHEAVHPAAEFIVDYTRQHPHEVTLVAIGPLTNIAQALQLDPTLVERVAQLVVMGGAEFTGNVTPSAEFNFWSDPLAADIVARAGFKNLLLVGLDATSQVFMSPGARDLLRRLDNPIAEFIYRSTEEYADYYWQHKRQVGAELCDVLAIGALVKPEIMQTVSANLQVCTSGLCEGRSVIARTERFRQLEPNAHVGTSVDTLGFFALLYQTLFPADYSDIAPVLKHEYR